MPDEPKSFSSSPPEDASKPTVDQPASPGGVKATVSGSVQSDAKTAPDKAAPEKRATAPSPAGPPNPAAATAATSAKTAAPAAAHPAAPTPAGPVPTPSDSPLVAKLKGEYGSGIEPLTYLGQNYI